MSFRSCLSLALLLLVLGQDRLWSASEEWLPFAPLADSFKPAELDLRPERAVRR